MGRTPDIEADRDVEEGRMWRTTGPLRPTPDREERKSIILGNRMLPHDVT